MKLWAYRGTVAAASLCLLAALCAAIAMPVRAADAAPNAAGGAKRPRICLALSGGGARGAAHVGVIKVLEEMRIPVHCIAGTSMGSLVGAAYASGMTVAEMEKVTSGITTELLFREQPPREEKSMRRKREDYELFFGPEIAVGERGLRVGKGLVTGVQLETVLRQLARAKGYQQFDRLPIPFRAVATDLVTGKPVVFSEGELADVMRASMSVPGAVAPAEFGGMMLVDGMLTNNLPVDVARAMGADIVIAVNVGTPLLKRDQLNGVVGVLGQMLNILTEQNVQAALASLKPTDILITPELGDFSTGDFDNMAKTTPLGEAAARAMAGRLSHLAIPAGEFAALRGRQQLAVAPDRRTIDEVRIADLQVVNPEAVKSVMQTEAGQPLDQAVLDGDMRRIYGMGNFEHVNYRFVEESGKRILVVDAVEKSWGKDAMRAGLGLSSDFKGNAFFNIIGSFRKYWVNPLGGEWRTDLSVGRTSGLQSEFYQPFSPGGEFFVAPRVDVHRTSLPLYRGTERIAIYDMTSSLVGVDVGTEFKRYGELRFGLEGGMLNPRLDTGPTTLSPGSESVRQGAFRTRLSLDRLDSVHFPRSGWNASANVYASNRQLGADNAYTKWDAEGAAVFTFGDHTFNIGGKAGGKAGSSPLPRYDLFMWGGFLQQSGYRTGQLYGENIQFARAMYYQRILRGSLLEGAYGGISLEAGKVGNPLVAGNPSSGLRSASVFVAADTPVGPAYLGYGRAADGTSGMYFYLGRPF
jgi:NTE family protein